MKGAECYFQRKTATPHHLASPHFISPASPYLAVLWELSDSFDPLIRRHFGFVDRSDIS